MPIPEIKIKYNVSNTQVARILAKGFAAGEICPTAPKYQLIQNEKRYRDLFSMLECNTAPFLKIEKAGMLCLSNRIPQKDIVMTAIIRKISISDSSGMPASRSVGEKRRMEDAEKIREAMEKEVASWAVPQEEPAADGPAPPSNNLSLRPYEGQNFFQDDKKCFF
jgi:hypothetical protein